MWWVESPNRALEEKAQLANLENQVDWLTDSRWEIGNEFNLIFNFTIHLPNKDIPLKLLYPSYFPNIPAQIKPIDKERLSDHQYGAGGELCLEYRQDNWQENISGAMMVSSAHALLIGENDRKDNTNNLPNAHNITIAQEVRNSICRFILDETLKETLEVISEGSIEEISIENIWCAENLTTRVKRVGSKNEPIWTENFELEVSYRRDGFLIKLTEEINVPNEPDIDFFKNLSSILNNNVLSAALDIGMPTLPIILISNTDVRFYSILEHKTKRDVISFKTILQKPKMSRLDKGYRGLKDKKIGIVGCGSVGSKIAVSLARAGVDRFVLIDGDLLYEENLVRNELDFRSIGLNKPDALEARIKEVSPFSTVEKKKVILGGQESSVSMEAVMSLVSSCDLVIDASGSPFVFNLCASVTTRSKIKYVWGEVFGGGIGGFIMRLRPEIDPTPLEARKQILQWCNEKGIEWKYDTNASYEALDEDKEPLIADDAEVTIIASHMTRMALDLLINEENIYPYSAYAIGLRKAWIFNQVFETWPISLMKSGVWGLVEDSYRSEKLKELLSGLSPPKQNEENDC